MESGIETAMISVLRQLPRNTKIMMPVRQAAMIASRTTPLTALLTKTDWSARLNFQRLWKRGCDRRQHLANSRHYADCRSVAGFQHAQKSAATPVLAKRYWSAGQIRR